MFLARPKPPVDPIIDPSEFLFINPAAKPVEVADVVQINEEDDITVVEKVVDVSTFQPVTIPFTTTKSPIR